MLQSYIGGTSTPSLRVNHYFGATDDVATISYDETDDLTFNLTAGEDIKIARYYYYNCGGTGSCCAGPNPDALCNTVVAPASRTLSICVRSLSLSVSCSNGSWCGFFFFVSGTRQTV